MRFEKFYDNKLEPYTLKMLDSEYIRIKNEMDEKIKNGKWTKIQKKKQINSILPNLALYKAFLNLNIPEDEAKELVSLYAYDKAEKAHKLLNILFKIPKFSSVFRYIMRKGMSGDEIWHTEILTDDSRDFSMDVTKCLWVDTCEFFGCYGLCEIYCICDHIVFGDIDGLEFKRNETLGMNGSICDFRFKFRDKTDLSKK